MKKTFSAIAAAAALIGSSGSALAVDIGGLNISTGATFAIASVYENVVTGVGQMLSFRDFGHAWHKPAANDSSRSALTLRRLPGL